MSRSLPAVPAEQVSPPVRSKYEAYTDQGGLLGAVTYALTVLETDDDELAATLASIPTQLFVTSSLHDDAIDEADAWGDDRKRRLNEHVTVGDLVFTGVLEAASSLPDGVDLTPVLETVRRIGRGQLGEEQLEPATATLEETIARVDERGAVWGDLAVALIDAVGGYSATQLDSLRRTATNAMFVLTVVDDVADLPEDLDNGVANVPIALTDADLTAAESPSRAVDSFLESDAPRRLEALLADRRAAVEAGVYEFADSVDRSDAAVLDAVSRALSWYCESVCSVPVEATVPSARQREIRRQLTGDKATRQQFIDDLLASLPFEPHVDPNAVESAVADLPAEPLAEVAIMLSHVSTVTDGVMSTSLSDALDSLERQANAPLS
ncbi:hypothetical protein GS429_03075 [Natronorubrum sp. JWXQ-INN-674]|uniref:Geranylgeranyl pyrophosphate synthase n=1 Tax=Natronorubrum halalkaliphilum TaxID=2691917 RepID=A0A6B0VJC2_9EURY|nr:class 1 isoprenoid biosynthesis enzyme [Natronorubrum halalkaliphilum]MXV61056.1 hypothetical protein [Natronorubrum halalkaliphilum]